VSWQPLVVPQFEIFAETFIQGILPMSLD
jgi:hypothetical protein